jgi:hypothetical protein
VAAAWAKPEFGDVFDRFMLLAATRHAVTLPTRPAELMSEASKTGSA